MIDIEKLMHSCWLCNMPVFITILSLFIEYYFVFTPKLLKKHSSIIKKIGKEFLFSNIIPYKAQLI